MCHGCQAKSDARRIEELEAALAEEQARAEEQAATSKAQLKVGRWLTTITGGEGGDR